MNEPDSKSATCPGRQDEQPQWEKDFPINTAQDNYVSRRDFTKFMVLTSFAFVVGQFCIGMGSLFRRSRPKPGPRAIAQLNQVAIGSTVQFVYPEEHDNCVLVRRGENDLLAFGQKCTHLSCAVIPNVGSGQFDCPCHEGCFDMATGRPIAGPPRRPLPRITLEVRDGTVYATGVERRTV